MRDMDVKLYNAVKSLVGTPSNREETRTIEEPKEPEEKKVVRRTTK